MGFGIRSNKNDSFSRWFKLIYVWSGVNVFFTSYPIIIIVGPYRGAQCDEIEHWKNDTCIFVRKKKHVDYDRKVISFLAFCPFHVILQTFFLFLSSFVCIVDSTAMILFRLRTNKCYRYFCGGAKCFSVRAAIGNTKKSIDCCNAVMLIFFDFFPRIYRIFRIGFYFFCLFFLFEFQIRAVSLARIRVLEINELQVHRAMANQRVCVPYWMKNNCKP